MANDLDRAYQWAINTCNAPNVGYSQTYRNQQTVNGITYYDCSSFVWYALQNGGFENIGSYAFTTYSLQDILPAAGWNVLSAYDEVWLPGDILLGKWDTITLANGTTITDYQHVEMCYQGTANPGEGYLMGAHGASGRVLADQVSILNTLSYGAAGHDRSKYTVLYRWGSGGATGYGLSLTVAAAILGNAWAESKVNPGCYHQNVGQYTDFGAGLWMWTNLGSMHIADDMQAWVSSRYDVWYSGPGQVACMIEDDLPNGSMWIQNSISQFQWMNTDYPTLQDFLDDHTETDLDKMTDVFFVQWETPGTYQNYLNDYQRRRNAAHMIYTYLLDHGNDIVSPDWYYELGYVFISDQNALENCIRFWRTASAGGGGGGQPNRKVGMPLWMMIKYRR